MIENQIEALLSSPPEREELVVQLFVKDGGQWGEIYRDKDIYWLDLYRSDSVTLRMKVDDVLDSLNRSVKELKSRLEGS